jgi:hypothetical protein
MTYSEAIRIARFEEEFRLSAHDSLVNLHLLAIAETKNQIGI